MALCITDSFLTLYTLELGFIELNPMLRSVDYSTGSNVMWLKIGVSIAGSFSLIKLKAFKVLVGLDIIMGIVCSSTNFQLLFLY